LYSGMTGGRLASEKDVQPGIIAVQRRLATFGQNSSFSLLRNLNYSAQIWMNRRRLGLCLRKRACSNDKQRNDRMTVPLFLNQVEGEFLTFDGPPFPDRRGVLTPDGNIPDGPS